MVFSYVARTFAASQSRQSIAGRNCIRRIKRTFSRTAFTMCSEEEKPHGHKRFVIDADPGVDDTHAIMMALAHPNVEVAGITIVGGNCDIDQIVLNAVRVLKTCNRLDIPVYRGSAVSLLGEIPQKSEYHMLDGLGDVPLFRRRAMRIRRMLVWCNQSMPCKPLLRLSQWYRGDLTLIALGPLTNIAMAIRLDAEFGKRLKHCYIMGGNTEGQGNITTSAEFNFHHDPEAASIVLNELQCPITQVGWEVTLRNMISWDWFDEACKADTREARFLRLIHDKPEAFCKKQEWGFIPCDQTAMAVALDDGVATGWHSEYATVELNGKYTRGQMVIDFRKVLKREHNCRMVTKIDLDRLRSCMGMAMNPGSNKSGKRKAM
ncbi:PREDICTED: inosine-uridine preferring nucleoside hydrolase-like [Priapulus caudatus]|uniref:Inosine-uridine preferring nucleoside hydrolase-like n=1 Tax=Priapulus caudatus TaxID=37621 RepID=A0ABM1DZ81_PRICU|nr:PREDICTED: inosine-uridine preferring nucleoside hydrolase-like [Priapulus caudatus]XP_014665252.1 PREDICTED: inosine-uridine preferring nucleoside hydrolase-like [Priapulus caudatus]